MTFATASACALLAVTVAVSNAAEFPDLLVCADGTRVETKEQWSEKRRPELLKLVQEHEYGVMPPKPKKLEAKVLREDPKALGGKATLKEIEVRTTKPDAQVHLLLVVPNKREKPAPCFLGLNFSGNYALVDDPQVQMPKGWVYEKYSGSPANQASEAGRATQKDAWSIEESIDRGYAVASFYNGDVIPDVKEQAFERMKGFVPEGMSPDDPSAPGTIACWAWAFSRMIDALEQHPEVDAKRIAVVGHSRNGKTALLAGAMDERVAVVIPSQAGCGGTAPARVAPELLASKPGARPKAETLAVINRNFPHWFCGRFKTYNDAPEKLPFDQHALIALCAPRPVIVSNATEDIWANPAGQFDILKAADPVYRLVAGDGLEAKEMPPVNAPSSGRLGYFIRPGKHAMTRAEWDVWRDYADRWLKK